jgi:crotonobetaine/carnitine-CoA ligase
MARGCKLVFVDWFSASKYWEHVVKYRCTITYTTGTIMAILLKQGVGSFEKEGTGFIRLWVPWPLDQPEVAMARWPNTKFLLGYGLSEYCHAATHSLDHPETDSQGPATPFTELKICDPETGKELPAGNVGEIVVRSNLGDAYMMQGYYKSPEETKRVLRDGWFYTGDAGYLDKRKLLHFVDRLKDSIRVAGENVPSVEVETIIKSHPKIMEAAIVGVKGELGHDEIMAHVVLNKNEELAPEEFFEFCVEKLAYFMVPKYLCIREELPKTATLRVQKYKLREEGIRPGCFVRKVSAKKK